MAAITIVSGGAVWLTLTRWRQVWCVCSVKTVRSIPEHFRCDLLTMRRYTVEIYLLLPLIPNQSMRWTIGFTLKHFRSIPMIRSRPFFRPSKTKHDFSSYFYLTSHPRLIWVAAVESCPNRKTCIVIADLVTIVRRLWKHEKTFVKLFSWFLSVIFCLWQPA